MKEALSKKSFYCILPVFQNKDSSYFLVVLIRTVYRRFWDAEMFNFIIWMLVPQFDQVVKIH